MSLFGAAILVTTVTLAVMIVTFVFRTEQRSWQGRQGEAALNAAATVRTFVQRAVDTLALTALWGRDELITEPGHIQAVLTYHPAFEEVILLDRQGSIQAQAQQDRPVLANLFTIPQSNWFREALAGRTYFSGVQLSAAGSPYLILAHPAGADGVIAARLDLTELWKVVANIHFGEQGRAYIVNAQAEVIAHTDAAVVLAQTSLAGRPELVAITAAPDRRWQGNYIDLNGVGVVGASAPVAGSDWVVITELPQSEAFAGTRIAAVTLGSGVVLFGALLSFVVARLLQSLIRSPLQRLWAGAERIGQGDWSHRVAVARPDEIGVVAAAFNRMADRLAARDAELAAQAEALRASEARYRAIIEDQTELICRWRPDGTLTFVNEAYGRYFNRRREDLVGRSFLPLIPDEDRALIEAHVARLGADHPVETLEHRVVLADGEVRWQQWTDRVLFGPDGAIVEFASVGRDITERRQAEAALRESEHRHRLLADELQQLNNQLEARVAERTAELAHANAALSASERDLRRIADNMLDMIVQVDPQGRYEYVSPSHQAVLGYAPAEMHGRLMFDFLHPDDAGPALAAATSSVRDRVPANLQVRFRHADGHYLWIESVGNPLRDEQDRLVGAIIGSRNITGRKQAEQRAAAFSELGYRLSSAATMEAAAEVIMTTADELLGWDVCFLDLYLADRNLMQCVYVIDTLDDGRRVNVTRDYAPYPPTETTRRVMADERLLLLRGRPDELIPGISYWGDSAHSPGSMMFVPLRNEARFLGVLSVQSYRDRAYDPAALQTLQALADHCASALERLRAEADVRASLHEKEVMLQEIHHRVKNNLQVISSLLNLQSRAVSDPAVLDLLRDSQNRVRSMALVHEKLYRSPDLARIDLAEYAHSLAGQLLRSYADQAGRVALRVQAAGCWLDVDTAVPCGLIINELVSNALKHAFPDQRAGEIVITLQPGPGRVTLTVRDTGVGFPAAVDFQASPSLGLQLVNSLVAQIDGTIALHRAAGTEFRISFPAAGPEE
jgi:PAS domain S-box-containing protein